MRTVSIVIPTLNEEARIGVLLRDLSGAASIVTQILVVDGGSEDATQKVVSQFASARFLLAKPPVGNQRQVAAQKASGQWLLFLDADVRISPSQIFRWVQTAEEKKYAISCPFYWPYGKSIAAKITFFLLNFFFWLGQTRYPSGAGAGFLVRKDLWKKSGGLRTDLVYEDIEFIRRAAKHGKFGMVPIWLRISDRRWVRDGAWRTLRTYLQLSRYFVKNDFIGAEKIHYRFGSYGESSADERA